MNKVFLKNIFSLSFIQIANYLFPFITIPYVVRIIGPEKLGIINLAQALVAYLIIIVNFGFDFTATRKISVNRNNVTAVSKIFSETFFAKIVLFVVTIFIYLALINLENYKNYSLVIFYAYIAVFANVFFPTWFFQGTERLTKTAMVNFFTRLLILILTFALIQKPSDYILVPLITSLGQLILNLLAFIYAIKSAGLMIKIPSITTVKNAFVDGWSIFISSLVINVYVTGSIIILGFFASNESVGYFSAVSKIIVLFQSIILYPIYQSLFPHLSKSFHENIEEGSSILRKVFLYVLIITTLGSIIIFIFAKTIILVIFGNKFLDAVLCLKIISVLPIITGISNVIGVQGLINLKKDKIFLIVTGTGAAVSIISNIYFADHFKHVGTAIAWVISETVVMAGFIYSSKRLKIRLFELSEVKQFFIKSRLFNSG